MNNLTEGASRGRDRSAQGAHGSAAPDLLPRHSGHHPQLLCGRNLTHGSILTASGATMAQTCAQPNRSGGAGI